MKLNRISCCALGLAFASQLSLSAQQSSSNNIQAIVEAPEVEMHVRFLASDALAGRDVGAPGLEIAASYLAEAFRSWGLKALSGVDGYRQQVPFKETNAPQEGALKIGDKSFSLNESFLLREGKDGTMQGQAIVLEYGTEAELNPRQVKGKWVIARAGKEQASSPQVQFYASFDKQKQLQEMGALGLIELYHNPQMPWSQITQYLTGSQLQLTAPDRDTATVFPIVWINDAKGDLLAGFKKKKQPAVSLQIQGKTDRYISSPNVLGLIEGSDPAHRDEYVLLSAHYDHVGIGHAVAGDSIYNGARDNAVGTAALLMAAEYFAKNPPKRSIIIAAWTAEEKGLLGSRWFVENPPVPLNKIIYNLNIDGAGYNDTTKVTVIGLERTEAEADLKAAAKAFGLEAIQDPMPEQNLFDRSDNVHFAKAGIPAPTYSMGVTAFDGEIMKYYHQPSDEAETINFNYVTSYIRSFILAAERVAARPQAPFWIQGDKYEAAGRKLYQK
ncbi:MAG: M20/M25/M40 family metallo-hydrolase [Bacteroidetes bacterium]|nr:M20/M25/M40 family metallo-hydrolase [Bacteroidota bacterium]